MRCRAPNPAKTGSSSLHFQDVNGMYARELSSLRELTLKASELHATVKSIGRQKDFVVSRINAYLKGKISMFDG